VRVPLEEDERRAGKKPSSRGSRVHPREKGLVGGFWVPPKIGAIIRGLLDFFLLLMHTF
jgi:hypothetical protein